MFTLSRSSLVALGVGLAVLAALRWNIPRLVYAAAIAIVVIAGGALAITHRSALRAQQRQPGAPAAARI